MNTVVHVGSGSARRQMKKVLMDTHSLLVKEINGPPLEFFRREEAECMEVSGKDEFIRMVDI